MSIKKSYLTYIILATILVLVFLEIFSYIIISSSLFGLDFPETRNYSKIRKMLVFASNNQNISRYTSLPYLNYIPNPGYSGGSYLENITGLKNEFTQHNEDGYRGKKVPVKKSNKFRILCLGGSTTYGTGVYNPGHTYPALLDSLLNAKHVNTGLNLSRYGVEVINAGLEAGNSAEELIQYLFKYRYYKPDLTIIHSGGNDAMIDPRDADYQIDYTNTKRLNFHLTPLPDETRWIMKSNFISLLVIKLFYSDFAKNEKYFSRPNNQSLVKWFDKSLIASDNSFFFNPFYQNHSKLLHSINSDGSKIIDITFALNQKDQFVLTHQDYVERVNFNNEIMRGICDSISQATFLKYTYDSISQDSWFDDCHLSKKGELQKAKMVMKCIEKIYTK